MKGMIYRIDYITYHSFQNMAFADTLEDAQRKAEALKKLSHVTEVKEIKEVKA